MFSDKLTVHVLLSDLKFLHTHVQGMLKAALSIMDTLCKEQLLQRAFVGHEVS